MTYSTTWATQNKTDRGNGEKWEANFQAMAEGLGMDCHKPQRPGPWWRPGDPLPDRVVVTGPDGRQWHELKHKEPTRAGEFGYEEYRLEANLRLARGTKEPVLYTIHDWRLAGARSSQQTIECRLEDWVTANVLDLDGTHTREDPHMRTYLRGKAEYVRGFFWPIERWRPLAWLWGMSAPAKTLRVVGRGPHLCGWARLDETEYVDGAGEVPVFFCEGCGTRFEWTARIAAEYLVSRARRR